MGQEIPGYAYKFSTKWEKIWERPETILGILQTRIWNAKSKEYKGKWEKIEDTNKNISISY